MNFNKFKLTGAKTQMCNIVKNSTELSPEILDQLTHAISHINRAFDIWPTSVKEN